MQLANILLALGGDAGNTVPKYEVTPAEVAVLQYIHGNESVTDIDISPRSVSRTSRAERERLLQVYGKPAPPRGDIRCEALDAMFPGVAARVFETFEELDIDDQFFKTAPRRAEPEPVEAEDENVATVNYKRMTKPQLAKLAEDRGVAVAADDKKDEIIAALEQADAEAPEASEDKDEGEDEEDEIGGMNDRGNLFQ